MCKKNIVQKLKYFATRNFPFCKEKFSVLRRLIFCFAKSKKLKKEKCRYQFLDEFDLIISHFLYLSHYNTVPRIKSKITKNQNRRTPKMIKNRWKAKTLNRFDLKPHADNGFQNEPFHSHTHTHIDTEHSNTPTRPKKKHTHANLVMRQITQPKKLRFRYQMPTTTTKKNHTKTN